MPKDKDQTEPKAEAKTEAKLAPKDGKKGTKAEASASPAKKTAGAAKASKGPKKTSGPKRAPLAPKTYFPKVGELGGNWKLIDASGQNLGRLSSYVAKLLMGKMSPAYSPGVDTGDHVIVINAEKIVFTGKKLRQKMYRHHTNYPGGLKEFTAQEMLDRNPERIIQRAVWGMLPKNKGHMVRHWYGKLRVFKGTNHPHVGQKPVPVQLPDLGFWERT